MIEPETLLEPRLDIAHRLVGILPLADAGMQRHHAAGLCNRPDMHMGDALDAFYVCDEVGTDGARIQLARGAFGPDMACFSHPLPTNAPDDGRDHPPHA